MLKKLKHFISTLDWAAIWQAMIIGFFVGYTVFDILFMMLKKFLL